MLAMVLLFTGTVDIWETGHQAVAAATFKLARMSELGAGRLLWYSLGCYTAWPLHVHLLRLPRLVPLLQCCLCTYSQNR